MCAPETKYPIKPEIPSVQLSWDDPMNSIPTDLLPEVAQIQECTSCGTRLSEEQLQARNLTWEEAQERGIRKHTCGLSMRQDPRWNPRPQKLTHHLVQPPATVIKADPRYMGPEL